jgi:hypothetical protein
MALTMLDPDTALIVVDLQKGLTGLPVIHPMGDIIGERVRWPTPSVNAVCPSCS